MPHFLKSECPLAPTPRLRTRPLQVPESNRQSHEVPGPEPSEPETQKTHRIRLHRRGPRGPRVRTRPELTFGNSRSSSPEMFPVSASFETGFKKVSEPRRQCAAENLSRCPRLYPQSFHPKPRPTPLTVCNPDGEIIQQIGGHEAVLPGNFIAPMAFGSTAREASMSAK